MKLREVLDNAAAFSVFGTIIVCRKDRDEHGQYISVFREVTGDGGFEVRYEYCPDQKMFPGAKVVNFYEVPEGSESDVLHDQAHYVDFDSEDWQISHPSEEWINKKMEDLCLRLLKH